MISILIFLFGFILGGLVVWIYDQITDKMKIAKTSFGIGKGIIYFILNKLKK